MGSKTLRDISEGSKCKLEIPGKIYSCIFRSSNYFYGDLPMTPTQQNHNKSEYCPVHEHTVELIDQLIQKNQKSDEILAEIKSEQNEMKTDITDLQVALAKAKKIGTYCLFFVIGALWRNPEYLTKVLSFLKIIDSPGI